MTIFAGAFSLKSDHKLPAALTKELMVSVSRSDEDAPGVFLGDGVVVVFVDLQLLPGQCVVGDDSGPRTFLAGDPLFKQRSSSSRLRDLESLHGALARDDDAVLKAARGNFCAAQIDPRRGRLRLATDKLGVRPLYFAVVDGILYFAAALRILEGLPSLKKHINLRGLLETALFGFPLAGRTPYRGIERLDAGEVLRLDRGNGISRTRYWNWNNLEDNRLPPTELSRALHDSFQEAVEWRLGNERRVVAHLSGGLDSRCVVAALLTAGAQVDTINLAPEGTLDLELGRVVARHFQTRHFEYAGGAKSIFELASGGHKAWMEATPPCSRPEHPYVTWTGNGGSCGVGHTYMTEKIVELMRDGRSYDAAEAYLSEQSLLMPMKVLRPAYRQLAATIGSWGVADELYRITSFDEGRRFHLFLMLNDQKRHLDSYYENIDQIRVELVNPFYDSEFLNLVLSSPIKPFLRHRLYNTWLKEFPLALDSLPWQAYQGHEPCALPIPEGFRHQTEDGWHSPEDERRLTARLLQESAAVLGGRHFPNWLLRKSMLRVAWWLTRIGVRDYSYLLNLARVCSQVSERATWRNT